MPFASKPQVFNASIREVTLGVGEKALRIGGENVLPFHSFDAPIPNAPKVGVEISDLGLAGIAAPGIAAYYAGCDSVAAMAKRAAEIEGASFLCLRFDGADPNGENRSVEDCVAIAKEVAEAVDLPLVVAGSKNLEKDTALFHAVSEALSGRNILVLSAREEDYKNVGASAGLAYGHKVGAESAVDINLAKQLNVLLTQLGVAGENIVMNLGSAAAGYGFEYVASTMDRVLAAALGQNDAMLQIPVITPVGMEAWAVKEALVSEEDMPEWGDLEQRGIGMEVVTAAACLVSGSHAVILKHPVSVQKIAALIGALQ
ncbi:MAG: acetyl-CoA decarbonylase/synthase complex subunit delta [Clostridia bacterium]|nr:acetyl-CoA decarbonylase/synthase complex subunit delta [Clostridia bacterium]